MIGKEAANPAWTNYANLLLAICCHGLGYKLLQRASAPAQHQVISCVGPMQICPAAEHQAKPRPRQNYLAAGSLRVQRHGDSASRLHVRCSCSLVQLCGCRTYQHRLMRMLCCPSPVVSVTVVRTRSTPEPSNHLACRRPSRGGLLR